MNKPPCFFCRRSIDGPLGYALSGDLDKPQLLKVAQAVYHQLNP